jgi:ATP-dependent DNA ligase
LLKDSLRKVGYPIIQSTAFNSAPADLVRAATELELEGVIAKREGSPYEPGRRSGAWVKYKIYRSQEFGCYEDGELRYVSRVKAGFNPPLQRELYALLEILETSRCPFSNLPEPRRYRWDYGLTKGEMENCRWLRPRLVAQIEFTEWTPDGHLRHSRFAALRDDKEPRQIMRE